MAQPTDVQANIIAQVREQLGGNLRLNDGAGREHTLNVPLRGVRFVLPTDTNAVIVSVTRRKRLVTITYMPGQDLYDVKITDLNRSGVSITAERTFSGVYFDTIGELIESPHLRATA